MKKIYAEPWNLEKQDSPFDPVVSETFIGLVQRYSPSGAEGAAVEYLVERMRALGYHRAFADETRNAVGILGEGPRQVVLLGHIDTVPGEIPVRIEGDRLYGRGSVDAKGPLAALVEAAARVGSIEGWQIIVIGAVDEERDSLGARGVIPRYHPDFAIIAEPSGWERVTLGYKGSAWAEIRVTREQAHTAAQGESACEAAFTLWSAVRDWAGRFNQGRQRIFDQVLPNLRGFESGEDGFEAWARLWVGARLPLDCGPETWYAVLEGLCAGAELRQTGFPMPAYLAEKNSLLVRAFLAGIRASGGQPGFVLKSGTADLNLAAPAWGCPAVAYGPGDSALDHTPEEHASLEEFTRSVEVLSIVLERVCMG
jgi:LysW-gamma-L-lysine carboxypeptidase